MTIPDIPRAEIPTFWKVVDWPAATKVCAYYTTRFGLNSGTDQRLSDTVKSDSNVSDFNALETNMSDACESNADLPDPDLTDYADFNLALHVNDDPNRVARNRQWLCLGLKLQSEPVWLDQIHSNQLVDLDSRQALRNSGLRADGAYTRSANSVCCVMTADCLPVLLSNKQGNWVAAAHAGWRGLASGIIENTIQSYPGDPSELIAWLGPAISQQKFEVGADVREIFVAKNDQFKQAFKPTKSTKYLADLYSIARNILTNVQIDVFGGKFCSYQESGNFFSFRRNPNTGRMASLIWIDNQLSSKK